MKNIKGYLIDPYTNSVKRVEVKGDYKAIYPLIDCHTFDIARVENNGDGIYIDDEGLLSLTPATRFFTYDGYPNPLAGKGLMLGCNRAGDSINVKLSLAAVTKKIKFYSLAEIRATYQGRGIAP